MTEPLYPYDPAEALSDPESVAIFMADAFETGDPAYIAKAFGVAVRAKGAIRVAERFGDIELNRSFGENGDPTLRTMLAVMQALGVDITAKPHGY